MAISRLLCVLYKHTPESLLRAYSCVEAVCPLIFLSANSEPLPVPGTVFAIATVGTLEQLSQLRYVAVTGRFSSLICSDRKILFTLHIISFL